MAAVQPVNGLFDVVFYPRRELRQNKDLP